MIQENPRPMLPARDPEAHKGRHGHVLVVGGSVGYSGAPRLAALGASAAGAGLVSIVTPEPVRAEIADFDPTFMVHGLPSTSSGTFGWSALRPLDAATSERDVWVAGPGCGRHPATDALLRRLVESADRPGVCDADALNAWADVPAREESTAGPRVFTPHPGEAARLLDCSTAEIQADREGAVSELHAQLGGVVMLKGAGSLITDGDRFVRNGTGNAALAVGGSGDVLAGMIAGLMAQGLPAFDAACAAVWLHGRAADELVAGGRSARGISARDVVKALRFVVAG